jgi:hypothetical protein
VHHLLQHCDSQVATISFVKAVTLRKLPPQVARAIQERSRTRKTSFNKAVISLLEEATGANKLPNAKHEHTDLDALAGSWTPAEAAAFDRELLEQRKIDEEIWK